MALGAALPIACDLVRDTAEVNKQFADMIAPGRVGVPGDIGKMIASPSSTDNY